ncbi:MAG: TolC family protein [Thermoguttaceae bacterium]
MSRQCPLISALMLTVVLLSGCRPQEPFYLSEDGDLSHYLGVATEIEYPDVDSDTLCDVRDAIRPFSLENTKPEETWDLPLEEAVRYALENSKVMRSIGGQIQGIPDFLIRIPEAAGTVYNPAIVESDARFGVEAALSAFDTRFTSSVFWEKNDAPRNTFIFPGGQEIPAFPNVFQQDLGTFQARLQKTAATGGTWSLTHNVRYDLQNAARQFPSDWNVNLEAEMRQPLLQGAGTQYNRIAGIGAVPGFNNGVMIARINTDIALADFEASVRNLVSDVEVAYWEVYYSYRQLDAVIAGRDSALQTWRRIYALFKAGARGGEAEKEAQAREQYFLFRSTVERSLHELYAAESKLRYIMGIAATDGRLIRPANEPTTAKVSFDWHDSLCESLSRFVELRRQKWAVKQRELELIAAKNWLLPRLDAVARYRWLGMGDNMIQSSGGTGASNLPGSNAYQSMTDGKYQESMFGVELEIPLGFRREMSGVRNAQLALARGRALLQEQELEVSHQLAYVIRELEANHVLTKTNFNRRIAAQRQVEAVAAAYEAETVTLDLLLDAQRRLAEAESDYYRSLVDYNKSIAAVHFRKGSLLEYNGVQLAEGPWPGKAYFDARRRARARDAGIYMDYGYTRPKVISRGPYAQHAGRGELMLDEMGPVLMGPEEILTPQPTPANPAESGSPESLPLEAPESLPPGITGPAISAPEISGRSSGKQTRSPAAGRSKPLDLGVLDLERLTSKSPAAKSGRSKPVALKSWSPVQRASYEEPVDNTKSAATSSTGGQKWTAVKKSGNADELVPNPPSAKADRTATGWKRVQR